MNDENEEIDLEIDHENPITTNMHRVCVRARPLVMIGTISIRAMISILAKARLEEIALDVECECPEQPTSNQSISPVMPKSKLKSAVGRQARGRQAVDKPSSELKEVNSD